mgnify:CR=1 FL=1
MKRQPKHPNAIKLAAVNQKAMGAKTSDVAEEHDIHRSTLYRWAKAFNKEHVVDQPFTDAELRGMGKNEARRVAKHYVTPFAQVVAYMHLRGRMTGTEGLGMVGEAFYAEYQRIMRKELKKQKG